MFFIKKKPTVLNIDAYNFEQYECVFSGLGCGFMPDRSTREK